jgi:parallel beta-helix repeat protein
VSGVFDNNTHYGINIRPNCARILVCNASASNNTAYGIYLEDADYCRFTNVVCKDNPNPYAGIIIKGTTNGKGIHNAIINCEFSKGEYTILLSTYADYTIIKGNDCLDNTRSGLSVVGEHNTYDQSLKSTALDLSGAAVDIATFHATCPCALAGYTIIYTEASSADAGVDVRVGRYQDGVALDDDYFDISTSEVSKNLGYSKHFVTADLTNKVIAAGDTVTVGTAGGKAGTGEVMIILHIVEMAK